MMNPMKNKLLSLEDIKREKQKLRLEISMHEYALNFNLGQIKRKLSFVSFSAYVFDLVREHFRAKIPAIFSGLISRLWRVFIKKK